MPYREASCEYSLALPELQQDYRCLERGAIYWLVIPNSVHAQALTMQTLSQTTAKRKAILVAQENTNCLMNSQLPITILGIKPTATTFLKQLPLQLDRALFLKKQVIVLCLEDERVDFWQHLNANVLRNWRNWLEENRCTLVVIASGPKAKSTRSLLLKSSASVAGFATLYSPQSAQKQQKLTYRVAYWRNTLGIKTQFTCLYHYENHRFHYITDEQPASISSSPFDFYKAPLIFQKSVVGDAANLMSEQWTVVNTWLELVEKGTHTNEATLVFGLRDIANLEELARLLYQLRQRRGASVRIVVFELSQMLRRQDEELLMNCGASGVFHESNLSRILQKIDEINRKPSTYHLTSNLDQAIALNNPMPACGLISTADFVHHLRSIMPYFNNEDILHLGSLIELTPMPSISAEHVISQFTFNRQGDMACLSNGKIYVFLFRCLPDLSELVLQRLLALPYHELIASSQTYLNQYSIKTLLDTILKNPEYTLIKKQKSPKKEAAVNFKKLLFNPKPISL